MNFRRMADWGNTQKIKWDRINLQRASRRLLTFGMLLLLIEFLDEWVYGAREAAWPLIRTDLNLTYAQIGLLLGLPNILGQLLKLPFGILGDIWDRRVLMVCGGCCFALELLLTGLAPSFLTLLLALLLFSPAASLFVNFAEATLMDLSAHAGEGAQEMAMARWALAGSIGVVVGPLTLGASIWIGMGWRGLFIAFAVLVALTTFLVGRHPLPIQPKPVHAAKSPQSFQDGVATAWQALQRKEVLRWLILLGFSDFMLDILLGFLALYFVDVVGVSPAQATTAVAIWTGVGLVGDALLIPLLRRVRGLVYLRYSAVLMLVLYSGFLLIPSWPAKLVLLGAMGLNNAGGYPILNAQSYKSMPGQSGTLISVGAVTDFFFGFTPILLGWLAGMVGLDTMMWLLLAGPISLLVGIPKTFVK